MAQSLSISRHSEDDIFFVQQLAFVAGAKDVTVRFGPLSATISSLFADGWVLMMWGCARNQGQRHAIRLSRGRELWRCGKATLGQALRADSLSDFVTSKIQTENTLSLLPIGVILASPESPFETLKRQYPRRRDPSRIMIGNQTLREFAIAETRLARG